MTLMKTKKTAKHEKHDDQMAVCHCAIFLHCLLQG